MRSAIYSLFACLSLGCVPPASSAPSLATGLELHALEVEGGWRLELRNVSEETVAVGCRGDACDTPRLHHEAAQADGTWVERSTPLRYARPISFPATLPPGDSFVIGDGAFDLREPDLAPGTHRAVVHTQGAGEVTLEYVVVGWSEETLRSARAIRARAEAQDCYRLVSTDGWLGAIDTALVHHLEPDALLDMHENAPSGARPRIREAMLERGSFVVFLSELLSVGSMDTVRAVGTWLSGRADPVQEPLRGLVAERLTDPLSTRVPVSAQDYELIRRFEAYWPDGIATHLVDRLESGPEHGAALVALLDVLSSSWHGSFDGLGPRILAALPARCDGATAPDLVESCAAVLLTYEPNTGFVCGGIGLSGVGVSGCGFGYHRTPTCEAISREWSALQADAGELEVIWLGT